MHLLTTAHLLIEDSCMMPGIARQRLPYCHTIKALCTCQHCMRCTLPIEIDAETGPTFVLMWSNQDVFYQTHFIMIISCKELPDLLKNLQQHRLNLRRFRQRGLFQGIQRRLDLIVGEWQLWTQCGVRPTMGYTAKHPQTRYSGYTQNGMFYGGKMFWTKGKCG